MDDMQGLGVRFDGLSYDVPSSAPSGDGWLRKLLSCGRRGASAERDVEAAEEVLPKAKTTTLLRAVSAEVEPGETMAVSASGGGKTTLLTLISGRAEYPASAGEVLFNGAPRSSRTRRRVGFVTQDDVFFSQLTVRQSLEFQASIVLPDSQTAEERAAAVDGMITKLMLRKCEHTKIGASMGGGTARGVSGGERKRLNIATEMLGKPDLLLLDEPTSNLDASTALNVVRMLRRFADDGGSVIASIHQPSPEILGMFDKVLILSEGETVWYGKTGDMLPYFEGKGYPFPRNYNPFDYVMRLLVDVETAGLTGASAASSQTADTERRTHSSGSTSSVSGDDTSRGNERTRDADDSSQKAEKPRDHLVREWAEASSSAAAAERDAEHQGTTGNVRGVRSRKGRVVQKRIAQMTGNRVSHDPEPPKYCNSFWSQARALGRRSLIQKRGNIIEPVALVQLFVTSATSVFWVRLGHTERNLDDRTGALFFFAAFWSFAAALISLHSFPPEKAVLSKDRAAGVYRLSAYYMGKTAVEFPLDLLYPFIFSLLSFFIIGFNTTSALPFFIYWLMIVFVVLTAGSLGLAISAVVMDTKWAQVLTTAFLLMSMLSGGYYSDTDNQPMWIRWTRYLSATRYIYESLVRNEFSGETYPCESDPSFQTVYSAGGTICPITEDAALRGAQVDDSFPVWANIALLTLWVIVARLIGYLALKYLHTSHKPSISALRRRRG